jgi:cellulose synthase/poly-beta-1,6-N-acetylglucosamine synthase-like glycosyltransferase
MTVLTVLAGAVILRQCFVLAAVIRSARFLRTGRLVSAPTRLDGGRGRTFFVVVPMLRETTMVGDSVRHLQTMTEGHAAQVIVVTTARENAADNGTTTADLVEALTSAGKVIHLHYPDPHGIKADQVNYAADYCATTLLGDVAASDAFVVVYDADSRPPLDSLAGFDLAIDANPEVSVFHQSSAFELRADAFTPRVWRCIGRWICDGGALRANRFVTGFEIPRLRNRSEALSALKRSACSFVYAHVTGHGLCVRLSLLRELPLPAGSPLEDMHWSFRLGTHNIPIVAVPSLDVAEVPDHPAEQVRQAARWFFGPGRALQYLRDPAIQPGWRARILAASALGSAIEWFSCAILPALTVIAMVFGSERLLVTAAALTLLYVAQLVVTEATVGAPDPIRRRLARVVACPVATTLFGLGGIIGAVRLMGGGSGVGKTERRSLP